MLGYFLSFDNKSFFLVDDYDFVEIDENVEEEEPSNDEFKDSVEGRWIFEERDFEGQDEGDVKEDY